MGATHACHWGAKRLTPQAQKIEGLLRLHPTGTGLAIARIQKQKLADVLPGPQTQVQIRSHSSIELNLWKLGVLLDRKFKKQSALSRFMTIPFTRPSTSKQLECVTDGRISFRMTFGAPGKSELC